MSPTVFTAVSPGVWRHQNVCPGEESTNHAQATVASPMEALQGNYVLLLM